MTCCNGREDRDAVVVVVVSAAGGVWRFRFLV